MELEYSLVFSKIHQCSRVPRSSGWFVHEESRPLERNNQSGLNAGGGGTVDSGEFVLKVKEAGTGQVQASAQAAWFRELQTNQSAAGRIESNQQSGHSVRCIQDFE